MKIGIIGAGAIGSTLAKVAVRYRHEVAIANSNSMGKLQEVAKAAGCRSIAPRAISDSQNQLCPFDVGCELASRAANGEQYGTAPPRSAIATDLFGDRSWGAPRRMLADAPHSARLSHKWQTSRQVTH